MSDEEFLKRWSRRKQEAKQESKAAEQAPSPPGQTAAASPETAEVASEPEIDLSKLPSIDSITAATDITEFLRKGIPAELSRAALRRAWATDPTIRDFVGLAENAWDFTDPNAIPGFGALHGTPEQIGAMVERVIGGVRNAADKLVELPEKEQERAKADQERVSATEALPDEAKSATRLTDLSAQPVAAAQPEASAEEDDGMAVRRRTHGGALPS
jgi:Protein of unknown function (DUF3306)